MTWVMPGCRWVCKTLLLGFDSLPSLQNSGYRFPQDCTRRRLAGLVTYHHKQHARIATEMSELREKHIKTSKELTKLKRKANE